MKKQLLKVLLTFVACVLSFNAIAERILVGANPFEDETSLSKHYVMYNPKTNLFYGAGNDYGTRATMVPNTGEQVQFVKITEGENTYYQIKLVVGKPGGDLLFIDANKVWVDGTMGYGDRTYWLIEQPTAGVDIYTIRAKAHAAVESYFAPQQVVDYIRIWSDTQSSTHGDFITWTFFPVDELSYYMVKKDLFRLVQAGTSNVDITAKMQTGLIDALNQQLTTGAGVYDLTTSNETQLTTAKENIEEAINAIKTSVKAYSTLNEAIETAVATVGFSNSTTEYVTAVAMYGAATADDAAVNNAAVALKKAVFDYIISIASIDNPVDLTTLIKNPSFEDSHNPSNAFEIENWVNTKKEKGGLNTSNSTNITGKDGDIYVEAWVNPGTSFVNQSLSQELQNIPLGSYTLKVYGQALQQGNADDIAVTPTGVNVFAGTKSTWLEALGEYEVNGIIVEAEEPEGTTGNLTIGINVTSATANWMAFDNFRLIYYGIDPTAGPKIELAELLATANSIKNSAMLSSLKQALETAILIGEGVDDTSVAEMESAISELQTAIANANASITKYAELTTTINKATALILPGDEGYEASQTLTTAIATAQNVHDAQTADNDAINSAITELQAVMTIYPEALRGPKQAQKLLDAETATNENPVDMTVFIINNGFETGDFTGWVNTNMKIQSNEDFIKDGTYFVEQWHNNQLGGTINVTQTVTGIPKGKYILKAIAHARNKNSHYVEGAALFAEDAELNVSTAQEYELTGIVAKNDNVTIGFKFIGAAANWIAADNFRLYYAGYDFDSVKDSIQKLIIETEAFTDNYMSTAAAADIALAVQDAQAAIDAVAPVKAELEAALTTLNTAIANAEASTNAYAALAGIITKANTLTDEETTELKSAVDAAQGIYDGKTSDVTTVNSSASVLVNAIETYFTTIKTELQNAITTAAALESTHMNSSVKAALTNAKTAAVTASETTDTDLAAKTTIKTAQSALNTAITNAETSKDAYAAFKVVLDKANSLYNSNEEGVADFKTVIDNAQDAYDNMTLDEAGLTAVTSELNAAINTYFVQIKNELQDVITRAETVETGYMSNDAASALNAAITNAEAAKAATGTELPDKTAVKDAQTALNAAIINAETSTSAYADFKTVIDEANSIYDADKAGATAFKTAIDNAQAAYDGKNSDETGIQSAINALETAIETFQEVSTSVNESAQDSFTIYSITGGVIVNAVSAENVQVYGINGQLIKLVTLNEGETFISLNTGIYIINSQKVIVK